MGYSTKILSRIAVCELPEFRHRAASPRDYVGGYVPGGRSENVASSSQG